jgi:hypothetical protein
VGLRGGKAWPGSPWWKRLGTDPGFGEMVSQCIRDFFALNDDQT